MELPINPNWTFKQVVSNIRALKSQYEEVLCSFSYFEIKCVAEFRRNTRNQFYALNIYEWQADKLWDYMNGFCPFTDFIGIIHRK